MAGSSPSSPPRVDGARPEPPGQRLRERAETVGGWVDLSSGPGGTTLILSVPLNALGETAPMLDGPTTEPDDPSQWGTL